MIAPVRGTQDFLSLTAYHHLTDALQRFLQHNNFTQVATPILEHTDLFKRSLGVATDVVSKEMYLVNSSHDKESSLCLRPEGTAPLMRAYITNTIQEKPWKVFAVGPMFRHERPQKGRYRQFHQATIELINAQSISHDAYLLALLDTFFGKILKIQSYALVVNFLGSYDDRATYKDVLTEFLHTHQTTLCSTCVTRTTTNPLRVFDCKNEECQKIYSTAPHVTDHLSPESQNEWQTLQSLLEQLSVSFTVKPTLVRGLDYYNKTVFEFVSQDLGAQNAFCGGGRYDSLSQALGEKQNIPSLGAGIGIERLMLILEAQGTVTKETKPLHVIVPFTSDQHIIALHLTQTLQSDRYRIEVLLDGVSVKSLLRKANALEAQYAILIGPDEQAAGIAIVKNMVTGDEVKKPLVEIKALL